VCCFGLQQWRALGDLILLHIAGKIIPSDALTKALGWMLYHRHCWFLMGWHGFYPTAPTLSSAASSTVSTVKEGVSGSMDGRGTQDPDSQVHQLMHSLPHHPPACSGFCFPKDESSVDVSSSLFSPSNIDNSLVQA
jgi:hypothetical protein